LGHAAFSFGRVRITSLLTLDPHEMVFAVLQTGFYDFRCWVKEFWDEREWKKWEKEFSKDRGTKGSEELVAKMVAFFGPGYYTLKDLPLHERRKVIATLTKEISQKISGAYEHLYDENLKLNEIYHSINLPIPPEVRYAAELTLSKRLKTAVQDLAAHGFNPKKAAVVSRILDAAKSFDGVLRKEEMGAFLSAEFMKRVERLSVSNDPEVVAECLRLHKFAKKNGVALNESAAQVSLFFLVKKWSENPDSIPPAVRHAGHGFFQLLNDLHLNNEKLKKWI